MLAVVLPSALLLGRAPHLADETPVPHAKASQAPRATLGQGVVQRAEPAPSYPPFTPVLHGVLAPLPDNGCFYEPAIGAPATLDIKSLYSPEDIRNAMIDQDGGAWFRGTFAVTLSVTHGKRATVTGLTVRRHSAPAPSWIFFPILHAPGAVVGCGGGLPVPPPSGPDLSWIDLRAAPDSGTSAVVQGSDAAKALPRQELVLSDTNQFLLVSTPVQSCFGNYDLTLVVTYLVPHDPRPHVFESKPFRLYGLARSTRFFAGYQDRDGSIKGEPYVRSGADRRCLRVPGAKVMAPPPRFAPVYASVPSPSPSTSPTPTPEPTQSPSPLPTEGATPSAEPTPTATR